MSMKIILPQQILALIKRSEKTNFDASKDGEEEEQKKKLKMRTVDTMAKCLCC